MADRLNPNEDLAVIGGSITSQDGQSTLVMQGDGNLVLYRAGGLARWETGTAGKAVSQAIMQGDGNFVMYGPGGAYIWDTATDGHPGAYLIVQDDGNVVIYDTAGNALWATDTAIIRARISGFLPGRSGLPFINGPWPNIPLMTINVLGQQIPIGNAINGLCTGMVFSVRDYFEAGIPVPWFHNAPSSGTVFHHIWKRHLDGLNLPFGPVKYMALMNPALPDHETTVSGILSHGRAWIMINDEWPKIKADIDNGHLSPIVLINIKSLNPFDGSKNHEVLAYGYALDGTDLTIHLYDPNHPDDDNVTMSLSIAHPENTTPVTYSTGDNAVLCFYRNDYVFSHPPSLGVGEHFYTTSLFECNDATGRFGYQIEGIACYIPIFQDPGTKPLYRSVSEVNGDHFYTMDPVEHANAIATFGYQDEGGAYYVFDSPDMPLTNTLDAGAIDAIGFPLHGARRRPLRRLPLHRLANSRDHFYTTSVPEKDNAISLGYQYEGVACYVFGAPTSRRLPLYRLLKAA